MDSKGSAFGGVPAFKHEGRAPGLPSPRQRRRHRGRHPRPVPRGTLPRQGLWLAQTPQRFRLSLLREAFAAATDAAAITDDASAVEAIGHTPMLVVGHPRNLKVTLPLDIRIAEMYLAAP